MTYQRLTDAGDIMPCLGESGAASIVVDVEAHTADKVRDLFTKDDG